MNYGVPTLTVVSGVVFTSLMYFLATETHSVSWFLIVSTMFVFGLFLAVHGLCTGVEATVAAGTGRTADE